MKSAVVIFLMFLSIQQIFAIKFFDLGIMVGTNASFNQLNIKQPVSAYDAKLGYNANAFLRLHFLNIHLQPELGYVNNRAGISINENGKLVDGNLDLGHMYGSVLIGYKIGKIRIAAGPLAYSLSNESFEKITTSEFNVESLKNNQELQWGAQVGLGLNIAKRWNVDARVQKTFTSTEFIVSSSTQSVQYDGTVGNFQLSLGYAIFKK